MLLEFSAANHEGNQYLNITFKILSSMRGVPLQDLSKIFLELQDATRGVYLFLEGNTLHEKVMPRCSESSAAEEEVVPTEGVKWPALQTRVFIEDNLEASTRGPCMPTALTSVCLCSKEECLNNSGVASVVFSFNIRCR